MHSLASSGRQEGSRAEATQTCSLSESRDWIANNKSDHTLLKNSQEVLHQQHEPAPHSSLLHSGWQLSLFSTSAFLRACFFNKTTQPHPIPQPFLPSTWQETYLPPPTIDRWPDWPNAKKECNALYTVWPETSQKHALRLPVTHSCRSELVSKDGKRNIVCV